MTLCCQRNHLFNVFSKVFFCSTWATYFHFFTYYWILLFFQIWEPTKARERKTSLFMLYREAWAIELSCEIAAQIYERHQPILFKLINNTYWIILLYTLNTQTEILTDKIVKLLVIKYKIVTTMIFVLI